MYLLLFACAVVALLWTYRAKRRDGTRARRIGARRVHLFYSDASGKRTDRVVDVTQLEHSPVAMFAGYCHLRREMRTFRLDRVIAAVAPDTGEVIEDLWRHLGGKPLPASTSRVVRESDVLQAASQPAGIDAVADVAKLLVYVCKADGQMRAPERAIVVDTCNRLIGAAVVDEAQVIRVPERLGVPTFESFGAIADQLAARSSETLAIVLDASERIVGTQRSVHPAEAEALGGRAPPPRP